MFASDFVTEHWFIYFRDVFQRLLGYVPVLAELEMVAISRRLSEIEISLSHQIIGDTRRGGLCTSTRYKAVHGKGMSGH